MHTQWEGIVQGCKHQKVGVMGGTLELVHHSIQQGSLCYSFLVFFFFKCLFIYLREREAEREGDRESQEGLGNPDAGPHNEL